MKQNNVVFELILIALLSAILFIQEEILTIVPNVQLTIFLLILYSKKLGLKRTTIIIFIHVILDNFFVGSFNIIYNIFMFIGWEIIPLIINFFFKKTESNITLAFIAGILSFIYCWIFIIPNILIFNMDFNLYIKADFIFEILLATSSFLSVLLLYTPCSSAFNKLLKIFNK